jgi:hypothetical protein
MSQREVKTRKRDLKKLKNQYNAKSEEILPQKSENQKSAET